MSPVSGIKTVPRASGSEGDYTTQGMISPVNQFVDPATGLLLPVSFRFLYGLFSAINTLQTQVATLQTQLNQIAGLE